MNRKTDKEINGFFSHHYTGTIPNIFRNCIINVGEIVVYDIVKEAIINSGVLKDGIPCHFSAAVAAGFCATLVASPVDVVKTRYEKHEAMTFSMSLVVVRKIAALSFFFRILATTLHVRRV